LTAPEGLSATFAETAALPDSTNVEDAGGNIGGARQKADGEGDRGGSNPDLEHTGNIGDVRQKPRKRGRPRVLAPELERALDAVGCYERKDSRRSRVDYSYMTEAMTALGMGKDERFHWLLGPDNGRTFRPWRQTLLAELGRCGAPCSSDDAPRLIRALAKQVCDLKPSTRTGVALLRRFRRNELGLGKVARTVGDPVTNLAAAVAATIREYRGSHPDDELTDAECGEALDLARGDILEVGADRLLEPTKSKRGKRG
jgi:hypothetical protein